MLCSCVLSLIYPHMQKRMMFHCTVRYSADFRLSNPGNQFFGAVFAFKGYPFKNIFDYTTAGDWDCVAAVERLFFFHYSVDFIFLSFGIMVFIVEL